MSDLPKYRIHTYEELEAINKCIDEDVKLGYKLHTFTTTEVRLPRMYVAVMSLSSSTKYDDIEQLVDVAPHEVNTWLEKGYIIADSWAKNIRMVKKK